MSKRLNPLNRLEGDQGRASSPRDHAALSASAGTGKTHVLTARVLRLLLAGADPSSILCLTFTKAGAAEMAERIHGRLAYWVRLEDSKLRKELFALDEATDSSALENARTLFARVLDSPGGGLRIQTIHAFAQSLLASFPAEAGLTPGFRPLEGREEKLLARQTLADLLLKAEAMGELPLIQDVQALSYRLGEEGAETFLMECARAPDAMEQLGPATGIEARLRRAFNLPSGDIEEAIMEQCCDEIFDVDTIRLIGTLNRGWATKNGMSRASLCETWLEASPKERAALLHELHSVWAKADGEIRSFGRGQAPSAEDYPQLAAAAFECCGRLLNMRKLAGLVASLAAGLRAGQRFADAYSTAKRALGVVDFDDLIRWTERLLMTDGMGDWVRYKLDQSTDHVLVDEAQDTNERQWNIVRALTLEYFAGEGAVSGLRTLFTVGDYKQAIFGFQGTDPEQFETARAWFSREAAAAGHDFLDLSMDRSFRSSPQVLKFVDRVLEDLGHQALGLSRPPNAHESHHSRRPGSVTLWKAFQVEDQEEGAGEEGWISDTVRRYAGLLARQIRTWLDAPFELAGKQGKRRPVRPEDILILVRRRGALASLIVARLHAEGVPVAGVDRLLLTAPLAVQDLLSAMRFAAQPLDDLNLAGLLVSPLFGWSQEQLFEVAHGRRGALWPRLRQRAGEQAWLDKTIEGLGALLAMADFATPHKFLETILSGSFEGRRKLLQRLGPEARDPIEELVSSALDFETRSIPSLQRFLDWFARGEVEIVRDPSAPRDAVRVMTAHGSKGLQAPIVILADACGDPDRRGGAGIAEMVLSDGQSGVPIFRPRKEELADPLKEQLARHERLEREEYWRLLYVAMTRAEERLYIGGALGLNDSSGPPEASWYRAAERALTGSGMQWEEDPLWGQRLHFGEPQKPIRAQGPSSRSAMRLPHWIGETAPVEARPPRPLTPSAPEEDGSGEPPPGPAMRAAAERGRILHQLFERLPGVPAEERSARAHAWLERSVGITDPAERHGLIEDACGIIADPSFAPIFGAGALAEAPIAAVAPDGSVISGTVDRLLISAGKVQVVDFKTGRGVPGSSREIPVPHLRQMAAYVTALRVIFPGHSVEAGLLYTAGPRLFGLQERELEPYLLTDAKVDG